MRMTMTWASVAKRACSAAAITILLCFYSDALKAAYYEALPATATPTKHQGCAGKNE